MKTLWNFLQPRRLKIAFFLIFTLFVLNISTNFEATSKVTWQASRGIPFTFIILYETVPLERCWINTICIATNIQQFFLCAFLFDMLVWYLISCAIEFGYDALKNQWKRQVLEHLQKHR